MADLAKNQNFQEIIDHDIRPQDDLYRHVNHKWLSENSIPEDETTWSNFNVISKRTTRQLQEIIAGLEGDDVRSGSIEQKVRDYYQSGVDPDRAEAAAVKGLREYFQQIDDCSGSKELTRMVARLHMVGANPLWQFYVDQDEVDSSSYLLRLTQTGLSLPDRDYYDETKEKMRQLKAGLIEHVPKMFEAVGAAVDEGAGESLYGFEAALAKHSKTATNMRDVEDNYNKMTPEELKELAPAIDWETYLAELGLANPPKKLSVDQTDYLRFINSLFEEGDTSTLRLYMKWQLLIVSSKYMGDRLASANFEFFGKQLSGIKQMRPLWERLTLMVDHDMGEALGKLYVERYFPPEAKQRMEVLVGDLKEAYAERIKKLDWMTPETKDKALSKLDKTYVKVGYPKDFRSFDDLDIYADSLLENHWRVARFDSRYYLGKLGKPVDREEWHMPPQMVNAYASPNLNEVVFPAGILQPPFFDLEADDAQNYGAIGAVIGHELTHHFDDQGRMFDEDGNLAEWWDSEDRKAFEDRLDPIIKQADSHEVLEGQNLNGRLTLGENIADVGGTEIAMQALEKALERTPQEDTEGLSPSQRFFLSYARAWRMLMRDEYALRLLTADPHATGDFRANNTVRNMDGFFEAFDVQEGDGMYRPPEERFRLW